MEFNKVSVSKLNLWQQCPQKFAFQSDWQLRKKYEKKSPALLLGENVHTALAGLYRLEPSQRTVENLERQYRAAWQRNEARKVVFLTPEEEKEWGLKGLGLLRSFHKNNAHDTQPLTLEEFVEVRLTPVECAQRFGGQISTSLIILAKFDRIDDEHGGLHVIDYKTGRLWDGGVTVVGENGNGWEATNGFASILYPAIAALKFNRPVVKFSEVYLEGNRWIDKSPSRQEIANGLTRIGEIVEEIRTASNFPPRPCALCKYCDYLPLCTAGQKFLQGEELPF